jgi:hypothetical protein
LNRIAPLMLTVSGFLVAGCQSTGVIPAGQDSYMIGKKDGSPGLGVSLSNKAAVYSEASAFCREKGLEVETLDVTVTPAMPARLGSTELHFKCVPPTEAAQAVANGGGKPADALTIVPSDIYEELTKLDELRKKGIITEDEFQARKAKILATK